MQIADFTAVNDTTFGDWQRDYLYKLDVDVEPEAPAFATNKGPLDKEAIDAYCDAVPIPSSKQGATRRLFAGQWYMLHGKLDSANTVQLTFRIDTSNKLYQYLYAWRQLAGSDSSAAGTQKALYIGEIRLSLYKTDKTAIGKAYVLKNAWIADLSDFNLDKTKDGVLIFTATVAYDKKKTINV